MKIFLGVHDIPQLPGGNLRSRWSRLRFQFQGQALVLRYPRSDSTQARRGGLEATCYVRFLKDRLDRCERAPLLVGHTYQDARFRRHH